MSCHYTVSTVSRDALGGWHYSTRPDGSIRYVDRPIATGADLALLVKTYPPQYGYSIKDPEGRELMVDGSWV